MGSHVIQVSFLRKNACFQFRESGPRNAEERMVVFVRFMVCCNSFPGLCKVYGFHVLGKYIFLEIVLDFIKRVNKVKMPKTLDFNR